LAGGRKIRKRTIANLTNWPEQKVEALRRLLKNEVLVAPEEVFASEQFLPHGHVGAVLRTIKKLRLDRLVSSMSCRERDLVVAMVAERLIRSCSVIASMAETFGRSE
jgi:hypothetical protein